MAQIGAVVEVGQFHPGLTSDAGRVAVRTFGILARANELCFDAGQLRHGLPVGLLGRRGTGKPVVKACLPSATPYSPAEV